MLLEKLLEAYPPITLSRIRMRDECEQQHHTDKQDEFQANQPQGIALSVNLMIVV